MSTSTLLPILLGAFLLLAAATVLLVGGGWRRARTGRLATETRRRDRAAQRREARSIAAATSGADSANELERSAAARARADAGRHTAEPATVAKAEPVDEEALGVTRRQFLNRSTMAMLYLAVGAFGAASLGFLWPPVAGAFGGKIRLGKRDDILAAIGDTKAPFYNAAARTYLTQYPESGLERAREVYDPTLLPGMEAGLVALWQKCPHLGCRVPWCSTSQWFECPCHASKYNRVGEKKGGPAPRGMDAFPIEIDGDEVVVNTGIVIQGQPIGTDTTEQGQEGPSCV